MDVEQSTAGVSVQPMAKARIGIVGGGLGGLMTAFLLEKRLKSPCDITIFEADSRVGGKVITREFSVAPVRYEAGAAELCDYSQLGPDPLRELVAELGFSVSSMTGQTVVMDDRILRSLSDIRRELGERACQALEDFNSSARGAISPAEYYQSDWQAVNKDPLASHTFQDLLSQIEDENARRYIEVRIHSDLATESHSTNAMYGLENYLMDEPD